MRTQPLVQKFFRESLPELHQTRCQALLVAVDAAAHGARVTIAGLGRALATTGIRIKHRVKRMDRLIGNRLLGAQPKPFTAPSSSACWQAARSRSCGWIGRISVWIANSRCCGLHRPWGAGHTRYEELHPYPKLGNWQVRHHFLNPLKAMIPTYCTPIIIADAGFRVPFYRYVETLGWHWLGRIRNRDFVQWHGAPSDWISAQSLHGIASIRAHDLGDTLWVRNHPLAGRLVLIMQTPCADASIAHWPGLHGAVTGVASTRRAPEPWLLIASRSLSALSANRSCVCTKPAGRSKRVFAIPSRWPMAWASPTGGTPCSYAPPICC